VSELAGRDLNQLAVLDDGKSFVGLLRREDVIRWIAFHSGESRTRATT
jgi:hypothetical protein